MTSARCRGDAGQVGGIEALPFGLLVFVVGSLLIANAWAVVDAKFATDAAARQAVRTFVEGTDEAAARHEPIAAGLASIEGHGRDPERATVGPVGRSVRCRAVSGRPSRPSTRFRRCRCPSSVATGERPFQVRSTHSELVDPFRSGVPGTAEACP